MLPTLVAFGNFVKIQNNNVTTTYAHCQTLLVQEGSKVGQGEAIATVGHTGDATRTSFTF